MVDDKACLDLSDAICEGVAELYTEEINVDEESQDGAADPSDFEEYLGRSMREGPYLACTKVCVCVRERVRLLPIAS